MTTPAHPFIAWGNRFADAIPVASSTELGAAVNLADFRPYRQWKPVTLPATVTVNCAAAKSADSLSVYNHNLFTGGCTIEVHGSTDNFVTSDVTIATKTPASNLPFVLNFTIASYQYWRIRITGTSAPTLSICALGVGMEFPTGLPYGFAPLDRKVFGQTNISEQGLPLGAAVNFEQWAHKLNFQNVDNAWIRSTFLPAWKAHLRGQPFLFAFDLTNYPDEIYLVERDGDLTIPTSMALRSNLQFGIKGVALT
jgi:hypothetical protein